MGNTTSFYDHTNQYNEKGFQQRNKRHTYQKVAQTHCTIHNSTKLKNNLMNQKLKKDTWENNENMNETF